MHVGVLCNGHSERSVTLWRNHRGLIREKSMDKRTRNILSSTVSGRFVTRSLFQTE